MAKKEYSNVDQWLERETDHKREALERASRHFDENDELTVNTLEAIYGQESSFGVFKEKRGTPDAAGHFQFEKATAEEYNLVVSEKNDQRFDIDYASSAAARYLKDLDSLFSKQTTLIKGLDTNAVADPEERKNFVFASYNGGQGSVAKAQCITRDAGKNPQLWDDVKRFLKSAVKKQDKVDEMKEFVEKVLVYELEFSKKSPANKILKQKKPKKEQNRCTSGHWVTIDNRPVFICD